MQRPNRVDSDRGPSVSLRLRDTSLGWDNSELVRNLSFDVPAGTWTCLLGESGVGKSTLLRTIAGLIEPRATTQVLADDGAPVAGRVAFMAQQDLLLPWLSAADNVALGARLRGERTDAARVRDLLERTGIAARGDARPGKLSGGERQRVALARTLMEDRPIVLMDEPFSALDAITRVELQALAFELLAGRTVVMVTHDPFEALRLATGVHVLSPGDNGSHIAMVPPGNPLRDPTDPSLRDSYRQIMEALGKRGMTGSPASAAA